jgi:hypothetical protein
MAKINRLSGCTDWIDLDFVERQRTPERAMKLGIQLQLAGLSLLPSRFSKGGVSRGLARQSTIGYRRPIYSPQKVEARITLRLTRL